MESQKQVNDVQVEDHEGGNEGSPDTNQFFAQFVAYHSDGRYDTRRSVHMFEAAYLRWILSQKIIHPVILKELGVFKRLGESKLISFVLHALQLSPNKPNIDRVKYALIELSKLGKIKFHETEAGSNRGRTVGWELVAEKRIESGTMRKVDVPDEKTGS